MYRSIRRYVSYVCVCGEVFTGMYRNIRWYVSYVCVCHEVSTGMYRNVRWYVDYVCEGAKAHECAWFVVWFSVRKYNM